MAEETLKEGTEDNVLTILCFSEQYAPAIAMRITPHIFSTRHYRKIAEHAIAHYERYQKPIGVHLRDLMEKELKRGDDGLLLASTIDDMENLHPELQGEFVVQQLDQFIEKQELTKALEKALDALAANDLPKARSAISETGFKQVDTPGIWLSEPEQALKFLEKREEDFFPCGIGVFDDLGILPARGTLFLFIAPSGTGKSWWLVNVGKEALLHRKSVLHITLEMSEDLVAQRYIQALYAMTRSDAKAHASRIPVIGRDKLGRPNGLSFETLSPQVLSIETRAQVAVKLRALKRRPPILIKQFPTSTLSISQLNAYLDFLSKVHNFRPDLTIIDYADLMEIDASDVRLDTGRLIRQLRGTAIQRNSAYVTASQGNRSSTTARVVRGNMVAEDFSKIQTADVVLTYSQTEAEYEIGVARVLADKVRNERGKMTAMITQNYDTGQFCLDSTIMSNELRDEVTRLSGGDQHAHGQDSDPEVSGLQTRNAPARKRTAGSRAD